MDRRSFVKACLGVAGAGTLAAAGVGTAVNLAQIRPASGGAQTYWGAHKVAGPAPRGIPFIPITVENGVFVGKPTITTAEGDVVDVLSWYKYCGHGGAPGLKADFTENNELTYFIAEEKLHLITPWFKDLLGKPVRPDDFPAPGFGASFIWRSDGQSGPNVLTGTIVKTAPGDIRLQTAAVPPAKPLKTEADFEWVRSEIFHEDFVAASTFCTHFCCIPAYREAEQLARPRNAWDKLFCTCHNSVYDHREPVTYSFAPETGGGDEGGIFDPLASDAEGGGH